MHQHNEPPKKEFAQFWQSIGDVMHDTDARLAKLGDQITSISAEVNQSSSVCYRIIEAAFRTGLRKEWSAKCTAGVH